MPKNILYYPIENFSIPKLEEEIINFWEKNKILNLYLNRNKTSNKKFVFYDGPPGTNGQPHIGHMLQSSLKDLWIRYKTMRGYSVFNRMGWDTHGLPIELSSQKDLNLISKNDILQYGVHLFSRYCEKIVFKYQKDWVQSILRLGRFSDAKNSYATLTNSYIQAVWWFIKKVWDLKLLYQSYKINPYCPRLGTSLSNQEVNLGYQEVKDISVYVKFLVKEEKDTFLIAWTTTPWSLMGNVALALNKNIFYIKIQVKNEFYILSENCLSIFLKKKIFTNYSIIQRFLGQDLKSIKYIPLWNFFVEKTKNEKIYYTILDDYVKDEQGTGIVHLSLYGEDDYRIIKKYNLPIIQHVNSEGKFINLCNQYHNRFFDEKNLDIEIKNDLKLKNRLLLSEKIIHKYPFNYKTGTRLLYFLRKSWFIQTSSIKDQMLKLNQNIHWYPSHIKNGRFGQWLNNNIDWAISRDRFWGTPIPIWKCQNCKHMLCIESIFDLRKYTKNKIDENINLHIPYIDEIELQCPKCFSKMEREKSVLDCWLDAAIMPWGQFGYPYAKGSISLFNQNYPADFICEGQDQTRGWFYGLLVSGIILKNQVPYKNVICTELVLDKNGQKMSKSKGNVIDPQEIFNEFGADSLRWVFFKNSTGNPLRLSKNLLKEGYKEIFIPLWNIYKFFYVYGKISNYTYTKKIDVKQLSNIDQWILSEIQSFYIKIFRSLDKYNSSISCELILSFIDKLSNWYIRRNRNRFWNNDTIAFDVLYKVLLKFIKILSPFLPFFSEYIYQELKEFNLLEKLPISVHLSNLSHINTIRHRNIFLEKEMDLVRKIVGTVHRLRNQCKLKIRQPLAKLIILCKKENYLSIHKYKSLILEELNIKNISFQENDKNLITYKLKPNLKILGRKLKENVNLLFKFLNQLNQEDIYSFMEKKIISFTSLSGENIPITLNEIFIVKEQAKNLKMITFDDYSFILNTHISKELKLEGLAREIVNKIQMRRKSKNLDILDKIHIYYEINSIKKINELYTSIHQFQNYIKKETLAIDIEEKKELKEDFELYKIDDEINIKIQIKKA